MQIRAAEIGHPRIADVWGDRSPFATAEPWPARVDAYLQPGVASSDVDRWVHSACVLCTNGDALDIAVKDGRIVGVRGREHDRVNHGRLGPKDLFGWQANSHPDRLTRPLVRRGGELVETDWDDGDGPIVDRSQAAAGRARGRGRIGFYTIGPAVPRGVLHAGGDRQGGHRHQPHRRQHAALHRHRGGRAQGVFGCDGQPGSYTDIDHADAMRSSGTTSPRRRPCCGCGCSTGSPGPNPPLLVASTRARTPVPGAADVHLALRPGTNVALMNGAAARADRATAGSTSDYVDAHTVGVRRARADGARRTRPSGSPRSATSPPRDVARAARDPRHRRAAALDRAAGLLPVAPGHRRGRAGQQHPPAARACSAGPGGGILQMNGQPTAAEHPRVRRRRRPARASATGPTPTHVEELARALERRPAAASRTGPRRRTRCRSSATPSRGRSGCCG